MDTARRSEDEKFASLQPARMFFWAVVSDEINRVIEFFPTRRQAEKMVAEALRDEPD